MTTQMPVTPRWAQRGKPAGRSPHGFWARNGFTLAVLGPTIALLSIFIYGFIAYTATVSVSQWQGLAVNLEPNDPLLETYSDMLQSPRFQADLRNITVFTVLFLSLAVVLGFVLAVLVHNSLRARGFFRGIFLFPYSLSFIVTGVVWRWIFTPSTGANLILDRLGIDARPGWITDPTVIGDVSGALEAIVPGGEFVNTQLGIPVALIPVVIAASWQLAGFAMAIFLAGLVTIPEELSEAASLDGARSRQYYWHVALPHLRPMLVTVLVILGHVSLKSFDLVVAMSGRGPGFATDVPGIYVFEQTFRSLSFNTGAAASMVMLLLVSIVIVPYLYRSYIGSKP